MERASSALDFLNQALSGKDYLLGADFSGADIMMGFTLAVARTLGVTDDRHADLTRYMEKLEARPAFQRAVAG